MACACPGRLVTDDVERVSCPCTGTDTRWVRPLEDVDVGKLWWQGEYRVALGLGQGEETVLRLWDTENTVGEGSQRLCIEIYVDIMVVVVDSVLGVGRRGRPRWRWVVVHESVVAVVVEQSWWW